MEITYTREVAYSLDLEAPAQRKLAKHLGLTPKQMLALAEEGELLDDHYDAVAEWVAGEGAKYAEVNEDASDPNDIEIHI